MPPGKLTHQRGLHILNKMAKAKDKIYAFIYNPMIEESTYSTISLHKTKEGAEIALKSHRDEIKSMWEKRDEFERKEYGDEYDILKSSSFGKWEDWKIEEIYILP